MLFSLSIVLVFVIALSFIFCMQHTLLGSLNTHLHTHTTEAGVWGREGMREREIVLTSTGRKFEYPYSGNVEIKDSGWSRIS